MATLRLTIVGLTLLVATGQTLALDLVAVPIDNPFFTDQQGMPLDAPCEGQTVLVNFAYEVLDGVSPAVSVRLSVDGVELCVVVGPARSGTVTVS